MSTTPVSAVDPQLIKVGLQFLDRSPATGVREARALGQVAALLENILSGQLIVVAAPNEVSEDDAAAEKASGVRRGPPMHHPV